MQNNSVIVVTGAAGFIGSCMVQWLNEKGYENLILADEFNREDKKSNLEGKKFSAKVEREELFAWLYERPAPVDFIIHLGARTDTTEFNYAIHQHLNVEYSEKIWNYCTIKNVPLIYASSAATYGDGSLGYKDDHELSLELKPLNPYGISKNEFDKWILHQEDHPPFWAGLKFFNVYGPNEYHKKRMASVIFHSFNQIKEQGFVKLFRSHRPDFKDGQQLRDFIYVKDVVAVIGWMMEKKMKATETNPSDALQSSLYNLGTGRARSFYDLVSATFRAQALEPQIEFIDMPEDIRGKYQYFTEADMNKLRSAGYAAPFYSLEEGVTDYVQQYLSTENYY